MIRLLNRLLVLVLGLALLGGGLLVVIEGIWTWTNSGFVWIPGSTWLHSFETTRWSDRSVIVWCVAAGAVGLVLAVAELRRQRPRSFRYDGAGPGEWQLLRRPTEAHIERRIVARVPASPVKVRLGAGPMGWSLRLRAKAAAATRATLETAAHTELDGLHAPRGSKVRVRTTGATRSSAGDAAR